MSLRPLPQLPQTVSASAAVTSSVRPSALPTSRIAPRGGEGRKGAGVAGRARAVVDDGGDDRGAVTAVTAIDILHHLLAAGVLEIDVDIRRLQPFFGNEP